MNAHSARYIFLSAALLPLAALLLSGCTSASLGPKRRVAIGPNRSEARAEQQATYLSTDIAPGRLAIDVNAKPLSVQATPFEAWTEQQAAAEALARIGPPAVPHLIAALRSPDPHVRLEAVELLGRMGTDAKDAVPDLIPLLDDPDEEMRKAAARALGRVGPDAAAAVPALMRTLLPPDPIVPPGEIPAAELSR